MFSQLILKLSRIYVIMMCSNVWYDAFIHKCDFICVCVCVRVCACVSLSLSLSLCTCVRVYACVHALAYIGVRVCVCVCVCECLCVGVCACACACVHMFAYACARAFLHTLMPGKDAIWCKICFTGPRISSPGTPLETHLSTAHLGCTINWSQITLGAWVLARICCGICLAGVLLTRHFSNAHFDYTMTLSQITLWCPGLEFLECIAESVLFLFVAENARQIVAEFVLFFFVCRICAARICCRVCPAGILLTRHLSTAHFGCTLNFSVHTLSRPWLKFGAESVRKVPYSKGAWVLRILGVRWSCAWYWLDDIYLYIYMYIHICIHINV